MRAVRFHAYGGPEQLRLEAIDPPEVLQDEVLVRVEHAAVNPVEAKIVAGQIPAARPPRVPGADFAGRVEHAAHGWSFGAAIFGSAPTLGVAHDGTYAELVAVPASCVVARPDALPSARAAALGVAFLTAWSAVVDAGATRAGETVLVQGAGGGVGSACVQIAARVAGARVIAVVSGDDGARAARALGAHETVDRRREAFVDAVARITGGRGADVAVDVVGGEVFEQCVKSLAPFGRLVAVGVSAGQRDAATLALASFYRGNRRLIGVGTAAMTAPARARLLTSIVASMARGELVAPEVELLPLAHAADALRRMASPEGAHGKLVLAV